MARRKNIIFIVVIAALVIAAVCFFRISTPEEYYNAESPLWESGPYAELSIDCKTAADNRDMLDKELQDEKYVPDDGVILAPVKIGIEEGESAYSILLRAAKYYKIPLDVQGAEENSLHAAYIRGINHLYEFSCGELSGWMYSVNGKFPSVGCDRYSLKDGDMVRFVYTCELGRDIGGEELE
ncbi:MAG: DUF4430 domain-containing protein [Clostridia bacterium]